jgi:glutamate/tyrosine decarboxylase-like PLP-dependent enzyme
LLPSDDRFRAIPELFEQAIRQDVQHGLRPFLLVANAGTTNTGAIDPLPELAEIARRHGLWYHLDAAYGGFFNLCPEGQKRLGGLSLSDSLVLDPHKGLFLPYGSGSLLVKEGELLRQAHSMSAPYLQDHPVPEEEYNPTDYSPELSRGYHGLRVWLPLKYYGVRRFRENLAEKLRLAHWLAQRLEKEKHCALLSPPDLSVVSFRFVPPGVDAEQFNRQLLKNILASKKLFISSTLLRGQFVLRACILSFRTHAAEVEEAADIICGAARQLLS